jgi:hypothetical protein
MLTEIGAGEGGDGIDREEEHGDGFGEGGKVRRPISGNKDGDAQGGVQGDGVLEKTGGGGFVGK